MPKFSKGTQAKSAPITAVQPGRSGNPSMRARLAATLFGSSGLPRQPAAHPETLDSEKSDLSLSYEFTLRVYDTELARDAWRFLTARWLLSAEARLVYRAATP